METHPFFCLPHVLLAVIGGVLLILLILVVLLILLVLIALLVLIVLLLIVVHGFAPFLSLRQLPQYKYVRNREKLSKQFYESIYFVSTAVRIASSALATVRTQIRAHTI